MNAKSLTLGARAFIFGLILNVPERFEIDVNAKTLVYRIAEPPSPKLVWNLKSLGISTTGLPQSAKDAAALTFSFVTSAQ